MDYLYIRHVQADNGEDGMSKNKHGKDAEDLYIYVPPGTTILDEDTGHVLADLIEHDEEKVVIKGGRGGRGNTRFTSAKNTAPHLAENGEPGEERHIKLELKLMADVGLVGFPSVGKSTLLSVVSAAKPKIADYHFTTLAPNLGVVETEDHRSFVMADLPGLIEGAHEGVGLGHQFLRHVERTRLLLHVIDMSGFEGRDPYEDYTQIIEELHKYDSTLSDKPQIIAANKMDMPHAEENLKTFKEKIGKDIPIFPISALTKVGLKSIVYAIADQLTAISKETVTDVKQEKGVYRYEKETEAFVITRDPDSSFVVSGQHIEKLFKMTDFSQNESIQRFARQMRRMGIDKELRKRGAEDGDIVWILDFEIEFIE